MRDDSAKKRFGIETGSEGDVADAEVRSQYDSARDNLDDRIERLEHVVSLLSSDLAPVRSEEKRESEPGGTAERARNGSSRLVGHLDITSERINGLIERLVRIREEIEL
ncbi:hypothetical protein [Rhodococcoides fascians]|uniref:hypothetical protein n=1 Tax=Rhodococcoides fascians TaxID=1828 RepID=UPI00056944A1|nr:hypothetical protein [Rhodococcus fascians]